MPEVDQFIAPRNPVEQKGLVTVRKAKIEFLKETDELAQKINESDSNNQFTELSDIRKHIEIVMKNRNYATCAYCNHIALQCNILKCTKCKVVSYCNKQCQRLNWIDHKKICNK